LHFWNEGALQAIGNTLGLFISVDKDSLSAVSRKIGRVMVEMDIHLGLPENLEIEWRGRRYLQRLDYLGVPFRCSFCRSTSHLRCDCKGIVDWDDEPEGTTHRDGSLKILPQDTGFYGPGPLHLAQGDDNSPESLDSIVGKLKTFVLFSFPLCLFGNVML
jgi:hypothetical protein